MRVFSHWVWLCTLLLRRVIIVKDFYHKASTKFLFKIQNSCAKSKEAVLNNFPYIPTKPLGCTPRVFQTKILSVPYLSFSSFLPSPVNKLPYLLGSGATSGWCSYIAFVLGKLACLQHCVVSFSSSQAWNMLLEKVRVFFVLGRMKFSWILYCFLFRTNEIS